MQARALPFSGATLRIIRREDFMTMKCITGGALDIADAEEAIRMADRTIDVDLLGHASPGGSGGRRRMC